MSCVKPHVFLLCGTILLLSHCLLVCGSPISYFYLSPFLVVLGNVFLSPYLFIPGFHLILEDVVQVTFLYDLM